MAVRGLAASSVRSAMRLKPMAAKRAAVKASTTQATCAQRHGCVVDATTTPTAAKGRANTVWGNFTKLAQVTHADGRQGLPLARRPRAVTAGPSPSEGHSASTRALVAASISITFGPVPREALLGPLARGIDAHLAAVGERAAGMIEHVHRPHREAHVALGVDVVERHPPRLLRLRTFTSLSTTTSTLASDISPCPHSAFITLYACPGYFLSMLTNTRLWNPPSAGMW
jgi:hypothetical protein